MDWRDALDSMKQSLPDGGEVEKLAAEQAVPAAKKGRLDIVLEKKGRGGKVATIISGFTDESDGEIAAIAASLKSALGTGGSARGGEILIQGDRRADVQRRLAALGYKSRMI